MNIKQNKHVFPKKVYDLLIQKEFEQLRPSQAKSVKAGLFENKNLLVCTPTASGKTLVAELAFLNGVLHDKGKAVYIVPLRALASEKYKQFKKDYPSLSIGVSSGDVDSSDKYLAKHDVIITTSEKFDSLLRHRTPWIKDVKTIVVDEIHLLNSEGRGPTLEIVLTLLRRYLKNFQLIGLSATIGNPEELANWLDAELIIDHWRPVELKRGIYQKGTIYFDE